MKTTTQKKKSDYIEIINAFSLIQREMNQRLILEAIDRFRISTEEKKALSIFSFICKWYQIHEI